ncbi:hypothetical protein PHSY_005036 [Pseudozyma hubeiensis SY62]|uniref:Uncharacterized protein n=1 Tax=Pseudozyma hubeiensis (strain SY62) TaxID=1305764 RepID=R9PH84_PSEHS|nr:hypothetical protein PHSY_005036 [Pseudozyma hubeiensis SY62]GAC97450.1 hypothetical protein PHSY_005036 [Pseudozyma hubeiensis SY62]
MKRSSCEGSPFRFVFEIRYTVLRFHSFSLCRLQRFCSTPITIQLDHRHATILYQASLPILAPIRARQCFDPLRHLCFLHLGLDPSFHQLLGSSRWHNSDTQRPSPCPIPFAATFKDSGQNGCYYRVTNQHRIFARRLSSCRSSCKRIPFVIASIRDFVVVARFATTLPSRQLPLCVKLPFPSG